MYKKIIFIIVAVVAVVMVVWNLKKDSGEIKVQANQFNGQIQSIEGDKILAKGYLTSSSGELVNEEKSVKIEVNNDTELKKIIWHMLSSQELAKRDGKWNSDELIKENQVGSMDDLSPGVSIEVKSKANIFDKSSFKADSVQYIKFVYPD